MLRALADMVGALCLLVAFVLPAPAAASEGLEPGVHRDPGSPAAHEYALPLQQARGQAAPTSGSTSGAPPAFGVGIVPGRHAGGSSAGGPTQGARSRNPRPNSRRGEARGSGRTTARGRSSAAVISPQSTAGSGDGSVLALLGGGAGVLALAGLGGVLMRRHGSSHPPG